MGYTPPIPTVVVSRPGAMQQALRASLALCSRLAIVASAGDGLTGLNHITRLQPTLVVIDSNLPQAEAEALLAAAKGLTRPPRCLVLVQMSQREPAMLAAGADAVLRRDSTPYEVQALLLQLAAPGP